MKPFHEAVSTVPAGAAFPMSDFDANGVDRSQIKRQLALSPLERMLAHESFLASVIRIRHGVRRTEAARNPVPNR